MMKKKNIIIILILLLGVALGRWVVPNNGTNAQTIMGHEDHNHTDVEEVYTCSMHPQIRQAEFGKCPICAMDLVLVGSTGNNDPYTIQMSSETSKLARVRTSKVQKGDATKEILLQGKIAVNEAKETVISARFAGRIESLSVEFEGMEVEKDQVLAEIYSPELIAAQNELLEAKKYEEQQPDIVESARIKLKLWNISDEQISQIESSKEIIQRIKIRSPYKGVVQKKYIHTGGYIKEGMALFQVVDLSKLWVVFDMYEEDLRWVKIGDKVDFRLVSLPGKEFSAKVSFIDPILGGASRTLKIRLDVNNLEYHMKPDMFVKGLLKVDLMQDNEKVVVPKTAVLWTGKRSIVYIASLKDGQHNYSYREVTISADLGDSYLLDGDLEEGEEVVTMGVFKIDAAAQLSGKYSMMNPPVTNGGISSVPNSFKLKLDSVFKLYLSLKNDLVESNLEESKTSFTLFNQGLMEVEVSRLDENLSKYWEAWVLKYQSKVNLENKSPELSELRQEFSNISDLLIILTEDLSFQSKIVFKAHCSMAFGNKGAFWLSESKEIANPYYGATMLTCGTVEQVYK